MLTRLSIRNFKRFENAEIELGKSVVFVGPNNSGKTTALQALALWELGVRHWDARYGGRKVPEKRLGVPINRRDVISIPIPAATLLWRDLHIRNADTASGKPKTNNIRIEVIVEGITDDKPWVCGLEFDYDNVEVLICRPLRLPGYENVRIQDSQFSQVPDEAKRVRVAFLPPMSGLADREFVKQPGEIDFLIGQGQTAQVLRNLCYQLSSRADKTAWQDVCTRIEKLFGIKLMEPKLEPGRAEILMEYGQNEVLLDLSSAGRGLQQTLLLLTHLYANPKTVLLLDEPDAHLEILRQQQTYELVTQVADACESQIVCASHSEIMLREAAARGTVIAFVGKPHRMNDRGSQVVKSLTTIGWDQYYQAELTGWVLYVEDATDLAILRAFAQLLHHPVEKALERPFCHYVSTNVPQLARDHFYGLTEAKPDLRGYALFDFLEKQLAADGVLVEQMWSRREIENYFCFEEILIRYARGGDASDLFSQAQIPKREAAMREAIAEVESALRTFGKPNIWSPQLKATDDVLEPIFRLYFAKLKLPITFRKAEYFALVKYLRSDEIVPEIAEKLDRIYEVFQGAKPASA